MPPGPPSAGPPRVDDYDVVVIGGGFAGSSIAILLKERLPTSRVLILERRESFDRKVGEATVEVSGFFLNQVLGAHDELGQRHLSKHGLRYWFTDGGERKLSEMTEIGPSVIPHLPSFQLDRSSLDEHLLTRADAAGVVTCRRARVTDVALDWPESRVTLSEPEGKRTVRTRWVVDASGRRAYLAHKLDTWTSNDHHPTAAVWCRWTGALDMDATEAGLESIDEHRPMTASRRLATNHFCGYGWWCWVIPLANGETSVGLVYHKDLFELPGSGNIRDRYRDFVTSQDGLRELLTNAVMAERDCRTYPHLAYASSRYAGRGWALIGDSASFIDPYYSPGLDHAAISIYTTLAFLEDDLRGRLDSEGLDRALNEHNQLWARSYKRWSQALYFGKYEILGDSELTTSAFLVDTAMYYLGVVSPVYESVQNLDRPVFGRADRGTTWAWAFLFWFNRRLNRLARFRIRVGTYGRGNAGRRVVAKAPGLGRAALPMLFQGLRIWLRIERQYLRYRLTHRPLDLSTPIAPPTSSSSTSVTV